MVTGGIPPLPPPHHFCWFYSRLSLSLSILLFYIRNQLISFIPHPFSACPAGDGLIRQGSDVCEVCDVGRRLSLAATLGALPRGTPLGIPCWVCAVACPLAVFAPASLSPRRAWP